PEVVRAAQPRASGRRHSVARPGEYWRARGRCFPISSGAPFSARRRPKPPPPPRVLTCPSYQTPQPGLGIFCHFPLGVTRSGNPLCRNMVSKSRRRWWRATEFVAAGAKAKFVPLLVLALTASLGACVSTVADLPPQVGGLPAGTPQRPAEPGVYPAVHD